jgi:hypothetical protein
MCRCAITLNDESFAVGVCRAGCWSQCLTVSGGFTIFTVWCERPCSVSFRLLKIDGEETFEEYWGQLATLEVMLDESADVELGIALSRSALLSEEERTLKSSLQSLKENDGEQQADRLFRTAAITTKISTFLANLDEFCVVKRRLWMRVKQLLSPSAPWWHIVESTLLTMEDGSRTWRRSSGSFSTMMRFVQRSKDNFKWQSEIGELFAS